MAHSTIPLSPLNIISQVQFSHIKLFRSDPANLWNIDYGVIFIDKVLLTNTYNVGIYRNGIITLGTVTVPELLNYGFHLFPVIFYFSKFGLENIPLHSSQSIHHLPIPIDRSFSSASILSSLIISFQTSLFAAYPQFAKYGFCYVYAELFRGRDSFPLFQFYLNNLQLPIKLSNPVSVPLTLTTDPLTHQASVPLEDPGLFNQPIPVVQASQMSPGAHCSSNSMPISSDHIDAIPSPWTTFQSAAVFPDLSPSFEFPE